MNFARLLALSILLGTTSFAGPRPDRGPGPRAGQQGPRQGPRAGPRADRQARFLAAIEREDPVRYARIIEIRGGHPELFQELIMGSASMLKGQQGNPQARSLFTSIIDEVHGLHTLLGEIEGLSERQAKAKRPEVERHIGQIFDLRQQARELRLKTLEERVRKMREQHDRRAAKKDNIVQEFTDRVLNEPTGGL